MTLESQSHETTETVENLGATNEQASSDSSQETVETTEKENPAKSLKDLSEGKLAKTGKTSEKTTEASQKETVFTPNYKFKAVGKEHEIDEFLRPVIKDPETEKKIRELYEKAYGIDFVNQERQSLKEKYTELETKSKEQDQALAELGQYIKEDDLESFFDALKIPRDKVLKYAMELVNRSEMTPEQKQEWQRQRQIKDEARYYKSNYEKLEEEKQVLATQKRNYELDVALSKPDTAQFASSYGELMGSQSAFKDFVISVAKAAHQNYGVDLKVEEAITQAIATLKKVNPSLGDSELTQAKVIQRQGAKPVIPNIQGKGTTPVAKTYKSFEDLKRRKKELDLELGQQQE
jgi:hypothetical protein